MHSVLNIAGVIDDLECLQIGLLRHLLPHFNQDVLMHQEEPIEIGFVDVKRSNAVFEAQEFV